jgi:hypothetical protein
VQNRLAKLKRDGTTAGFILRMSLTTDERRIGAFVTIAVEGNPIQRAPFNIQAMNSTESALK